MQFDLKHTDPKSKARAGVITTDHGAIETPIFMPVGTVATVKGVHQSELKEQVNPDIILANTYHLYLRPKTPILEQAGGIHKFMNWDRNILTDSGGYQVYSLSGNRKIKEEGVKFKSHIDGATHFFTPENVMEIQRTIGADIIMAFDECTPYPCDYNYAKRSMHMTHRWLKRCINHLEKVPVKYGYDQTFFPIVQGSTYKDLRKQSAEFIASVDAEANAIGGLSVGEPADEMYAMTDVVCINIKNKKWENDFSAIDEMGITAVDTMYSKAYLRHLFASKEMLGKQIASIHNLGFYLWLTREARKHILAGDFVTWKDMMVKQMDKRL